ncbi:MAG: hypothetical protein PHS53_03535 [Candidatus Pacebacteria bacterium]|nr:hypothetical protein [Candidatus Paceibacterota bacterium]MDD5357189.1 hypothetical protein [Candidatus Paceibacterota bacterium]
MTFTRRQEREFRQVLAKERVKIHKRLAQYIARIRKGPQNGTRESLSSIDAVYPDFKSRVTATDLTWNEILNISSTVGMTLEEVLPDIPKGLEDPISFRLQLLTDLCPE